MKRVTGCLQTRMQKIQLRSLKLSKKTDEIELNAFIGLLILKGVFGAKNENIRDLWPTDQISRPLFNAVMSRNRSILLQRLPRFDDRITRLARRYFDNSAPIRQVFDAFNATLRKHFKPSETITIDEMLVKSRGNEPFKVYMKDKPANYRLLFRVIADAGSRYLLNMVPYTGKPASQRDQPTGPGATKHVVMELVEPWLGPERNITGYRLYTYLDLAEKLYYGSNFTMVGILISNRHHIPAELKVRAGREVYCTIFAYSSPLMLASYYSNPNKLILMASTMHQDGKVSEAL